MQTSIGAGTPGSDLGTPSSPGEKLGRADAKKRFRSEVDMLVQAVKLIPTYADAFAKLNRTGKLTIGFLDANNQPRQYELGRKEYKEFISHIVKRMQSLPTLAFSLNKTRRKTGANAGFLAPAQFSPEIVNFFANADIGPVVEGVFMLDKRNKIVPDPKSLVVRQGTRLNQLLYFTQQQINGQANPLYGIISPGTLTPLFAIHAYYSRMQQQDARRISASQAMRQALAGVMQRTIENDSANLIEKYTRLGNAGLVQQVQQVTPQLIQAINNPALQVNSAFQSPKADNPSVMETNEIFNPNYFLYAHFSKLISNGKVPVNQGGLDISDVANADANSRINQIRRAIPQVYGQNTPGVTAQELQDLAAQAQALGQPVPHYENAVLKAQQNYTALAGGHKKTLQAAANSKKKAAENAAKRQAQQVQIVQPMMGGFPVGQPGIQ